MISVQSICKKKKKKKRKKKYLRNKMFVAMKNEKTINIIKTVTKLNIKFKKCLSKLYFDGRTMALFFTARSLQEIFLFLF